MSKQIVIKDGCTICGKTLHLAGVNCNGEYLVCSECFKISNYDSDKLLYERDLNNGFKCVLCGKPSSPYNIRCGCAIDNDKYCI